MKTRALLSAVAFALVFACGSTGSKRFAFEARAGGVEGGAAAPFVNGTGWTITLSKAVVTVGPVYLNVVAPLRTSFFPLSLVKSAYADDEHLGGGRVVGEVLAQVTVDALSGNLTAFPALGTVTQEPIRTADLWLYPPPGVAPEKVDLAQAAADFAGEAVKGDARVRFRGAIVLDEAWASSAEPGEVSATPISETRQIRGVPAAFYPEEGGVLELRVDVRSLFRGADFGALEANPTDPDGTKVLVQAKTGPVTTDQVMRNAYQGLRAARGTWELRWTNR